MKLSTRARYGTRALLDIALHGRNGVLLLRDIARRQEISLHYLEHLIAPLITAGIIRTARGAGGGVWLAKPTEEIKLSEVLSLLEGGTAPVECVNDARTCSRSDICVTRDLWCELKQAMDGVLESTTLQDLAERQKRKVTTEGTVYQI